MSNPASEASGWVAYRDSITGRLVLARSKDEAWEVSDGFVIRSMDDEVFRARFEEADL